MGPNQKTGKLDRNRRRAEQLITRGRKLLDRWDAGVGEDESDLDRAERLFRDSVRLDPENADGWRGLGDVLRQNASLDDSLFAEALAAYERARDLGMDHVELWHGLALAANEVPGHREEAVRVIERALALDPDNTELLDDYAGMLTCAAREFRHMGTSAEQQVLLERCLEVVTRRAALTPGDARPFYRANPLVWQGALLLQLKRAEEALEAFVRVEASDAATAGAFASVYKRLACFGRALAHEQLGTPEQALKSVDEGLAHEDVYEVTWHAFRAHLLVQLGQPAAALIEAKQTLADFDLVGYVWHVYAAALAANGLLEEARVAEREAASRPQRPLPIDDLLPKIG